MSNFLKYPSLINSSKFAGGIWRKWGSEILNQDFYATEKLHGANFNVSYNGEEVKFGKRNGFLEVEENFFNHEALFTNYDLQPLIDFYEKNSFEAVTIFGEYYGAGVQDMGYEANVNNITDFKVFNVVGQVDKTNLTIIGYDEMISVFGVKNVVPFIEKGKIFELLDVLDMEAKSKLGGVSEGYVIQPYGERSYVLNGDFYGVKHKTEAFSEVSPSKTAGIVKNTSVLFDLERYVTENRLNNLLSKGDLDLKSDRLAIVEAYLDDVFAEYEGSLIGANVQGLRNQLKASVFKLLTRLVK